MRVILIALVAVIGCKAVEPPAPRLSWTAPPGWSARPRGNALVYVLPRATGDSDDGELVVKQVPGTVDRNLSVWARQLDGGLESLQTDERRLGGWSVVFARSHGAFRRAPGQPPKPGWSLVVAMIGEPPNAWYFKMLGPDKTVREREAAVDRMIESAHF